MKTIRISFGNTEQDDFGMPTDFRSYIIIGRNAVEGESISTNDGIAKVYTASLQASDLNPDIVISPGGAEKAIEAAIEKLKALNKGFHERIHTTGQL